MDDKKVIVFVFPGCMGGVSSFNRNIINFSEKNPGFSIRVILLNPEEDSKKRFEDAILADQIIDFRYSIMSNQRNVYKRLSRHLGDENGCIVTDNWLTLDVIRQLGTPKSVVHLIHDYYYIDLVHQFKADIDACITHASFFRDVLLAADIDTYQNKAYYIPYGVEQPGKDFMRLRHEGSLRLTFLGRWVEYKGVLLLNEIDAILQKRNIPVEWTIMGAGPLDKELKAKWNDNKHVQFITAEKTEEIYRILSRQDILVFPSKLEGTPVAIMEAMSRGAVPVATDLPGGTRDMVTDGMGFRCQAGNIVEFADAIERLHRDRGLLHAMQTACLQKSAASYDIKRAANEYFRFFENMTKKEPRHANSRKLQLNILDSPLLPDRLVYMIRKMRSKLTV
jgi:glycosyltransferase involved in cell wall biosynthesis